MLEAIVLLMVIVSCGGDTGSAKNSGLKRPIVAGYLPQWKMPYNPQWQKLTHVFFAFGAVNFDGSLKLDDILKNRRTQSSHQQILIIYENNSQ
jgi:GH18 family chitinase